MSVYLRMSAALLSGLLVVAAFTACGSSSYDSGSSSYDSGSSSYDSGSSSYDSGSSNPSDIDESDYDWDGDGELDYETDEYGQVTDYSSDPAEQDELDAFVEDYLGSMGIDPNAPADDPSSW